MATDPAGPLLRRLRHAAARTPAAGVSDGELLDRFVPGRDDAALEGRARAEPARRLGIPEGTHSSRLAMARKKLADRLARRGLALSAAAVGVGLPRAAASAGVPAPLVTCTVKAAAAFASGSALA